MLILIAACEIGFWLILAGGLTLRYATPLKRTAKALLVCVPITDLILLAATVVHLRSGAEPQATDGLAAVYLGVSIAFGPTMVSWADARFAHRFARAARAAGPAKYGREHARHERGMWLRHLLAFTLGSLLLLAGTALAGGPHRAASLLSWIPRWAVVLAVDAIWSYSYTIVPRKQKPKTSAAIEVEKHAEDMTQR